MECRPAAARLKIAKLDAKNQGVVDNADAKLAVAEAYFARLASLIKMNAASEQEFNEAGLRLDRAHVAVKIE